MSRRFDNRRLLVPLAAAGLLTLLVGAMVDRDASGAARRARPIQVSLTVGPLSRAVPMPHSFLGLSTEYKSLPVYEQSGAALARILALLRVPGDGPLLLRVGGNSADHTFWDPTAGARPAWMFPATPVWLRRLRRLVHRSHIRLIFDLNLVTGTADDAAAFVSAARAVLPRGSIAALEIGNEPDIYSQRFWRARTLGSLIADRLPPRLTPTGYDADFATYAHTLAAVAPGVPLIGPAIANPNRSAAWVRSLLAAPHPGLGEVSVHAYPFTICTRASSPRYPTIARLLGARATAGLARTVADAVREARGAHLPLRMTELNSVTCGGRPGVSDAFATALWAPQALFSLARAGVNGVNVHVRTNAVNAAFAPATGGLAARPLLYGLIMFARTLGPSAALVPVHFHAGRSTAVGGWAVRVSPGFLHVLVVNHGARPASVDLHLPARGAASVERLLAPSARARTGVTLDGQRLGADGRWRGAPAPGALAPSRTGYRLGMPSFSAALVSVPLMSGAR